MCEAQQSMRFEALDITDPAERVRPVIEAALAAADVACCGTRKNAVSRAVFDTATGLGFRVAWGDVLNPDAPDFYVWPVESWHEETIRRHLADMHALPIRARDLAPVAEPVSA